MDKLEKALQKAREERAKNGPPSQTKEKKTASPEIPEENRKTSLAQLKEIDLDRHHIISHHPRDPRADIFRILRTQVLQSIAKHDMKTIGITSPNYGDGKTTVALNLALSIAQDVNQTVLLVDLDLRKPSLHQYLGLEADKGLIDYLVGDTELSESLQRLPYERLTILPAGRRIDNSSETLGLPEMSDLAEELRSRYPDRLIIYDLPPILEQDDPITFMPHIDGVLLVVQEGATKQDDLRKCLNILDDQMIIGTILNEATTGWDKQRN